MDPSLSKKKNNREIFLLISPALLVQMKNESREEVSSLVQLAKSYAGFENIASILEGTDPYKKFTIRSKITYKSANNMSLLKNHIEHIP